MDPIDVTELMPNWRVGMSPEERARREQIRRDIRATDFSQSVVFGGGMSAMGRALRRFVRRLQSKPTSDT